MIFRVQVPMRMNCERIAARGIFPGAEVVRGCDWRWRDQDGNEKRNSACSLYNDVYWVLVCAGGLGMTGKVVSITGWQNESSVSYSN